MMVGIRVSQPWCESYTVFGSTPLLAMLAASFFIAEAIVNTIWY